MAIQRKPKVSEAGAVDAFIGGAPDAKAATPAAAPQPQPSAANDYAKGVAKGNKRQISLTIAPHLLRRVDEMAQRTGQTRAGIINLAVSRALDGDFFK